MKSKTPKQERERDFREIIRCDACRRPKTEDTSKKDGQQTIVMEKSGRRKKTVIPSSLSNLFIDFLSAHLPSTRREELLYLLIDIIIGKIDRMNFFLSCILLRSFSLSLTHTLTHNALHTMAKSIKNVAK
jgi:hypothetical protein